MLALKPTNTHTHIHTSKYECVMRSRLPLYQGVIRLDTTSSNPKNPNNPNNPNNSNDPNNPNNPNVSTLSASNVYTSNLHMSIRYPHHAFRVTQIYAHVVKYTQDASDMC